VANQDTPQDHAFFAALYNFAVKEGIKYVINGSNYATESILPQAWVRLDGRGPASRHPQAFGTAPLRTFPWSASFDFFVTYPR
jgi:hypothetical protein